MTDFEARLRALIVETVRDEVRRAVRDAGKPDDMLTTIAAAKVAGVAVTTIRRWARDGKLTCHRAGSVIRVSRRELVKFLKTGAKASNDSTPEELAVKMFGTG